MSTNQIKLIKPYHLPSISTPSIKSSIIASHRLKIKTFTYQISMDSDLASSIKDFILSNLPEVKRSKISGKLNIHLHLGGVMAIEFTEIEHLKPSIEASKP